MMEYPRVEQFGRRRENGRKLSCILAVMRSAFPSLEDAAILTALFLAEGAHVHNYGRPITGARWLRCGAYPKPDEEPMPAPDDPTYYLSKTDAEYACRYANMGAEELASKLDESAAWRDMVEGNALDYKVFLPDRADDEMVDDFVFLSRYCAM